MTTLPTPAASPPFATAGVLLDALAAYDFDRIAEALEPGATLSALLPRGHREWAGAEEIRGAFEMWFGDLDTFAVVDASVGHVGSLLELRWRLHVEGARFGDESMVVEQHVYATTGTDGRINHMRLLCSGFWPQHG